MTEFADIDVFVRVVNTGSLSSAARELGVSPAVVSKRLTRLEKYLGARLLNRTTRQISLTEAGEGYYERAIAILAMVEEAHTYASENSEYANGTLKITAPTTFGRMHIAPYLNRFMKENPAVKIELTLSDDFANVVGEGIDLAIRIGALDDSSLVAKKLAHVHRVLCASPDYLKSAPPIETIEDLQNHVRISTSGQDPWQLEGPEGPITVHSSGPLTTNSNEVVREAVLSGVGIALRSTWDVGRELASGELKMVLPDYRGSRHVAVYAVYPSKRFLPLKVRAFVNFLSKVYGPTPYWDDCFEKTIKAGSNGLIAAE